MRALLLIALIGCGDASNDIPKGCKQDTDCPRGTTCQNNPQSNKMPGVDKICAGPK